MVGTVKKAWEWVLDDHVILTDPNLERYFARCIGCGRVFMHYWACVTAEDREHGRRVGCVCGGMKFRPTNLPQWQQAWFLLSRYVWRKLIKKEQFWDPRLPFTKRVCDEQLSVF